MADTIDDWVKPAETPAAPADDWIKVDAAPGAAAQPAQPSPSSAFPPEEPGYAYGDMLPFRWKQGPDGVPTGMPELAWPRSLVRGMQEVDARLRGPLTPGKMEPTGPDLYGLTGLGALGGGGAAPRPTITVRPNIPPAEPLPAVTGGPVAPPQPPPSTGGMVPQTDFQRLLQIGGGGGGGTVGGSSGRALPSMAPRALPPVAPAPQGAAGPAAAAASEMAPKGTATLNAFDDLLTRRPYVGQRPPTSEPPASPPAAAPEAPPAPPAAPVTAPVAAPQSAPAQGAAAPPTTPFLAPAVAGAIQSLRTTMADPRTPQQIAQAAADDQRARLSVFQMQLPEGWTIGQQPGAGYVLTDPLGATVPVSTDFPTFEDFGRAADIAEPMIRDNAAAYEAALRRGDGTPAAPVHVRRPGDVAAAAERAAEPSPSQAEAGNYRMGHVKIGGVPITIENAAGSQRTGISPDGTPWTATLPADYGYIKRTKGADGDKLDVYLGPQAHEAQQHPVFVIDQRMTEAPAFDEHKVMLGFPTVEAALHAYRSAFSDGKGHDRIGAVSTMTWAQFRQWQAKGNLKRPVKYKPALTAKRRKGGGRIFTAPMTLMEFLATRGGIKDQSGALKALGLNRKFIPGVGALVRKNGMPLDRAREAAAEARYLDAWTTPNDLVNLLDEESRGRPQYSRNDAGRILATQRAGAEDDATERYGNAKAAIIAWAAQNGVLNLQDAEVEAAARVVVETHAHFEDAIVEVLERTDDALLRQMQLEAAAAGKGLDDGFQEVLDAIFPDEKRLEGASTAPGGEQASGAERGDAGGSAAAGGDHGEAGGSEPAGGGGAVGGAPARAGSGDEPRPGAPGQADAGEADLSRPAAILADLDARNAPDIEYRDAFSTGSKRPLGKGETWRGRLVAWVDRQKAQAEPPAPTPAPAPSVKSAPEPDPLDGYHPAVHEAERIYQAAHVVHEKAKDDYRARKISDAEFIAARNTFNAALAAREKADEAIPPEPKRKPQTERVDTLDGVRDQGLLGGIAEPLPGVRGLPKKPEPPKQQAPGGMFDSGAVQQTDLVGAIESQDRAKYGSVAAPNVEALAQHFRDMRAAGKKLVGQPALYREAARLLGGPVMPGSRAAQAVDRALYQSHQDEEPRLSVDTAAPQVDATPAPAAIQAALSAARTMTGGKATIGTGRLPGGVMGVSIGPVILAALSTETPRVIRHEVVHALRNLGVIGPAEWATLEAAAKREGWVKAHGIEARYGGLSPEAMLEEAIGDQFAAWETGTAPAGGMLARAYKAVTRFFDRAGNALHARGFQTAADVFGKVEAGEIGARDAGSQAPQRGPQTVEEALARLALFAQFADPAYDSMTLPDFLRDMRFATAPTAQQAGFPFPPASTFATPPESRLDSFIYEVQDKHVDTKRVIQAIERTSGKLRDARDPYLAEELYHGRVAKQTADFLADEVRPLMEEMARRGVSIEDFDRALWARHAEERNKQIASINPAMPDGGSGLMTADAHAILAGYTAAQLADFDALGKMVDAITLGTRDLLVRSGLENQATIDAWNKAYQHYVPLMREDMEGIEGGGLGTGRGFSVRGPHSKRAMGSGRNVVNILANLATQRERAIVRAEKNVVANALVALVHANPQPDWWKLDQPTMRRHIDAATGLVVSRVDPTTKDRDNVIVARAPGRMSKAGEIIEHTITFNEHDPRAMRMARALKNLDLDDLGHILTPAAKVTRFIAAMNTQYNPIFGIVNLIRDTQEGALNLSNTPLAGKQKDVAKLIPAALRGIYTELRAVRRGQPTTTPWATLWEEFQRAGGQTGYRDLWRTSDERAKALEAEIRRVSEGKAKKFGRAMMNWLSDYNEAIENSTRLAAYKVGTDAGLTPARAASIAKNLTVNFNRRGAITQQTGALYAFFNANVQGIARNLQTLMGPAGRKIIAGGILLGAVQATVLQAAGFTDADLPGFVKENNVVIPLGGKRYATIPMPLGFKVLPNLGRIPIEIAIDQGSGAVKKITDLVGILVNAANPLGGSGVSMQTVTPSAVDPFAALAENKDWTGRPIARENFSSLDPKPGHARTRESASWLSTQASHAINRLSGGTEFTPGALSPTPDQIDYLVGQFTGGVGREAIKAQQTVASIATGDDLPTNRIPLVGRFYGNADTPSAVRNAFYEHLKEINAHEAEIKGRAKQGRADEIDQYMQTHPTADLYKDADRVQRAVSAAQRELRALKASGASRAKTKAAEADILDEMRAFNALVDEAKAAKP